MRNDEWVSPLFEESRDAVGTRAPEPSALIRGGACALLVVLICAGCKTPTPAVDPTPKLEAVVKIPAATPPTTYSVPQMIIILRRSLSDLHEFAGVLADTPADARPPTLAFFETYWINHLKDVLEAARQLDDPNIALLIKEHHTMIGEITKWT